MKGMRDEGEKHKKKRKEDRGSKMHALCAGRDKSERRTGRCVLLSYCTLCEAEAGGVSLFSLEVK